MVLTSIQQIQVIETLRYSKMDGYYSAKGVAEALGMDTTSENLRVLTAFIEGQKVEKIGPTPKHNHVFYRYTGE